MSCQVGSIKTVAMTLTFENNAHTASFIFSFLLALYFILCKQLTYKKLTPDQKQKNPKQKTKNNHKKKKKKKKKKKCNYTLLAQHLQLCVKGNTIDLGSSRRKSLFFYPCKLTFQKSRERKKRNMVRNTKNNMSFNCSCFF